LFKQQHTLALPLSFPCATLLILLKYDHTLALSFLAFATYHIANIAQVATHLGTLLVFAMCHTAYTAQVATHLGTLLIFGSLLLSCPDQVEMCGGGSTPQPHIQHSILQLFILPCIQEALFLAFALC
jgi:hypothetical protein